MEIFCLCVKLNPMNTQISHLMTNIITMDKSVQGVAHQNFRKLISLFVRQNTQ